MMTSGLEAVIVDGQGTVASVLEVAVEVNVMLGGVSGGPSAGGTYALLPPSEGDRRPEDRSPSVAAAAGDAVVPARCRDGAPSGVVRRRCRLHSVDSEGAVDSYDDFDLTADVAADYCSPRLAASAVYGSPSRPDGWEPPDMQG